MSARRRLSREHDELIGLACIPLAKTVCRMADAGREADAERAYNFLFEAAVRAAEMLKPDADHSLLDELERVAARRTRARVRGTS